MLLEFCSSALKPIPRHSSGRANRTTKAMIFPPAAAVRLGRNTNKAIKAMLSAMRRNSRSTFSISLPSGSSYACLPRDTLPSFKLGQVHLMLWTCILALYRQLYDSYTVISDSRPLVRHDLAKQRNWGVRNCSRSLCLMKAPLRRSLVPACPQGLQNSA